MRVHSYARLLATTLVVGSLCPSAAVASSLQIDPIRVELERDKKSAVLSVINKGEKPVSVRVKAWKWTQEDGDDKRTDAADMIVSPRIASIGPGATQVVRIGPRVRNAATDEKAYRIVVEEIPDQQSGAAQVRMALRIDLPMYVTADRPGTPELAWQVRSASDGRVEIDVTNKGATRSELLGIEWITAAGRQALVPNRPMVVLANSRRRWTTVMEAPPKPGQPLTLSLQTPSGEQRVEIIPAAL